MSRPQFPLLLSCLATALFAAQPPRPPAAPAAKPAAADPKKELKPLDWRPIGPANMGGRVSDIALIPGKSHQYLVATATGGVFLTKNGGTTFSPVFDDQPNLSTGSVAVSPSDPKIVWVGGGEGNGRNSSSWGDGIYKSEDGGGSFTNMGLKAVRDIPRVAIHPKSPDTVYACALGALWNANPERGVYRTTDGGKTWTHVLKVDENHGCIDLRLDPANPETLYAALYARRRQPWSFQSGGFGDQGGIYKSVDGGTTWARLTNGLPKKTGRIGLALWEKDPSHVWAVLEADDKGTVDIDNDYSPAGGLFKSVDGGASWTRVSPITPRAFYFSKITIDPRDEDRIYMGGWGLSISDDGGANFRPDGASIVHPDIHAVVVDPLDSDHLLLGTDGGIYESWDKAKTWRYHDNIPLGQFYEIGLGMDTPYTVCGGLQDNGVWCGPSRGRFLFGESMEKAQHLSNQDWDFIWGGDGYFAAVDPRDPMVVYTESQQGWAGRIDRRTARVKFMHPSPREGSPALRFNWNSPLVMSPQDPEVVYLAGNRVFKFTERGAAWEAISPDLSHNDPNRVMATGSGAENFGTVVSLAPSPLQAGMLWAGTDDGRLWRTLDEGKNWQPLAWPSGVPAGTYVSRIEASHHDPATAYASFDGHRTGDNKPYVFMTADGGKSWRNLSAGLPAGAPARVVREGLKNPDLLFVGTEFGIEFSLDRGASWRSLRQGGLPAVQVHDLKIHPREQDLVAGTHGRSIWIMDDISPLEQLTPAVRAAPLTLFAPRAATGWWLRERGGMWGHDEWTGKNPKPGATLNYWLAAEEDEGAKLEIVDAAGRVVRELEGPGEAGLNRVTWDLMRDPKRRIDSGEMRWGGNSPLLPAGEYTVNLSAGKHKASAKLTVYYPDGFDPAK